jgi:hypothetical protein
MLVLLFICGLFTVYAPKVDGWKYATGAFGFLYALDEFFKRGMK